MPTYGATFSFECSIPARSEEEAEEKLEEITTAMAMHVKLRFKINVELYNEHVEEEE